MPPRAPNATLGRAYPPIWVSADMLHYALEYGILRVSAIGAHRSELVTFRQRFVSSPDSIPHLSWTGYPSLLMSTLRATTMEREEERE